MEQARGPGAEADAPEEEEGEAQEAMAAVVSAAGGACPAVLQVAGLYRGLCAVRSRALGLGFVSPAQLRVFPVRRGSGLSSGGTDGSGVSELETNPFYDRYRDKIQQLRRCGPGRVGGGDSWRAGRASGMLYCPAWWAGTVPTIPIVCFQVQRDEVTCLRSHLCRTFGSSSLCLVLRTLRKTLKKAL